MGEHVIKDEKQPLFTRNQIISMVLAFSALLILLFMPNPEGMTIEAQKSLAIFTFALIMWVGKPFPIHLTSIIVILLLPLIGAVEDQEIAFGTLGYDIIWLMVSAFVLTSAMSETNLGKRIALNLLTKFGKTPARTLTVLVLVNFILAFFVPSTTARASLLVPIVLVLLEVYKATPGESNFGKLVMLQGVQTNGFATSMVLTATSAQVIALGFINQQTGSDVGYMTWLLGSLPQALLTAFVSLLVGIKMFDYRKEIPTGDQAKRISEILSQQLADLGKLSAREKKAGFIFFTTLLLWATGDYHEALMGFEISTEQTAVIAMLLCFLPGIGILKWKEANIKWDLMIFSAGAYAAGNALDESGGASYLIGNLVQAIGLDKMNHAFVAIILITITIFSHLIFTSKTVRTTILIPAVITLAQGIGMDAAQLALACSFGIAYTITLPPHSKVNTLYFGSGFFTVLDELKYGLVSCLIGSVIISLVYFFWLPVIM